MSGHRSRREARERLRPTGTGHHFDEHIMNVSGMVEPAAPGQHRWVMVVVHNLTDAKAAEVATDPAGSELLLDLETVATIDGPGCLICCTKWTPEHGPQPCPGTPVVIVRRPR